MSQGVGQVENNQFDQLHPSVFLYNYILLFPSRYLLVQSQQWKHQKNV